MGILNRMSRGARELTKYYFPFTWKNKPSIESPINAVHLNHIEDGLNEIDNRVLLLAQDKAEAADMANVFVNFEMSDTTGVMTFTRFDGSKVTHDSAIEKIALNCYLEGDDFVLELADGTKQRVSLSKFIDTYTFSSSDTIRMTVNGKDISADIPDGKITLAKLEPTVTATIRQYMLDAQTAKGVAEQAASTAQGWAIGGSGFEGNNAKDYAGQSQRYAVITKEAPTDNAQYYCQLAQAAAEQAGGSAGYDGTATSVKATDIQGLAGEAGGDSNVQVLLDALAQKVARELVSNTALAQQLAGYVAESAIVQVESTATDKIPSSAYLKQALGIINSNLAPDAIAPNLNYGAEVRFRADYYGETLNKPDNNGGNVLTIGNGNNRINQLAMSMSGNVYARRCYNSDWTEWDALIKNSDIENHITSDTIGGLWLTGDWIYVYNKANQQVKKIAVQNV